MSVTSRLRWLKDSLRFKLNQLRWGYRPSGRTEEFSFAALRHLVIAKMDGKLGDSEVITPFISTLKLRCPELKISVISTGNVSSVYADILQLPTAVVANKADPAAVERALQAAPWLTQTPCDALLTTEPNFRARDLYLNKRLQPRYILGIEERSGAVNINLKQLSFGRHISQYFADLLRLGGISDQLTAYVPLYGTEERALAAKFFAADCLGLAPYGASKHRRLSDAVLSELCRYLCARTDFKLALLFKPSRELEGKLYSIAGSRLLKMPDQTTVLQYAALIGACGAVISVDSAAVHLANGSRVPVFGIYAGLDPDGVKRWGPAPFAAESCAFLKQGCRIDELNFADFKQNLDDFLARCVKCAPQVRE